MKDTGTYEHSDAAPDRRFVRGRPSFLGYDDVCEPRVRGCIEQQPDLQVLHGVTVSAATFSSAMYHLRKTPLRRAAWSDGVDGRVSSASETTQNSQCQQTASASAPTDVELAVRYLDHRGCCERRLADLSVWFFSLNKTDNRLPPALIPGRAERRAAQFRELPTGSTSTHHRSI